MAGLEFEHTREKTSSPVTAKGKGNYRPARAPCGKVDVNQGDGMPGP